MNSKCAAREGRAFFCVKSVNLFAYLVDYAYLCSGKTAKESLMVISERSKIIKR